MTDYRQVIIDLLKEINPESVLELGCGYGDNLFNIKKAFPNAKVVGTDIDGERLSEGMRKARREELNIEMVFQDIREMDFLSKSYDVVLTDAVLLMIKMTEEEIKNIIQQIVRTAKKMIILVEWHDKKVKLLGKDVGNRFVRNYVELLNMFEIKDIKLRKITEEEWDSKKWQQWGYFITAKPI